MISDTKTTLNESNYDNERISRLQRDLDAYLFQRKEYENPHVYIGEEYEKYIGYLCAQHGYFVDFNGIKKQKQDSGIDIIAKSAEHTLLIQCKCWSSERRINENVIDQLVGSKRFYAKENNIPEESLIAIVVTSTRASDEAQKHAKLMGIVICEKVYLKKYPQIKGFLFYNGDNAELEYRLPFDEDYYDDFAYTYFYTVQEAEDAGYKRVIFKVPPTKTAPSKSKETEIPIIQTSVHTASESQTKQKTIAPQKALTPQEVRKSKEKPSVFEILFYVSYVLVTLISIIILYINSAMEKGRLLSAVITGTVFGYLGFIVAVSIIKSVLDGIKELIDYFK